MSVTSSTISSFCGTLAGVPSTTQVLLFAFREDTDFFFLTRVRHFGSDVLFFGPALVRTRDVQSAS